MAEGIVLDDSRSAGPSWPALVGDVLPRVAASAGTPQFANYLVDAFRHVLTFDWWIVMIYREHANPEMLCDNFTGSWRARGLTTYVAGYYVLIPFYIMSRSLDHPEVCRLGDMRRTGSSKANTTVRIMPSDASATRSTTSGHSSRRDACREPRAVGALRAVRRRGRRRAWRRRSRSCTRSPPSTGAWSARRRRRRPDSNSVEWCSKRRSTSAATC